MTKIKSKKVQTSKNKTYKKCLKVSQTENIINYLEKKEIDADSLKEIKKY